MKSRYQTFVFNTERTEESPLGPKYHGGQPIAWMDGHALREHDELLDFVRLVRDNDEEWSGLELAQNARDLLNKLNLG